MYRSRLVMCTLFALSISAFVGGQEPKKDAQPPAKDDKGKKDQKAPDPKQPAPPKAEGKTFDFKFEKDKKFYQEQKTTVTQFIKAQGQDLTQKQESTFWFEYTPIEQQKDGKWKIRQRVEGLSMTIDISGNQIKFDSTQPENPSTGNPGLTEFFKKLVGAEFTATIDSHYKVEKVDGAAEFIRNISAGSVQMDALLKRILTEDALKEMCDPTKNMVPETPRKQGESWTKKATVSLGPIGSYDVTYTFTYVGPEKDMDKIDVVTLLNYKAPPDQKTPGAGEGGLLFRIKGGTLTTVSADAKTPTNGTILYNPKTGRMESADISIKLKGKLTVTIGGTDTEVELEQEQKTSVKTRDTSFLPVKK